MFIITCIDIETVKTSVCSIHQNKKDAVNKLYEIIQDKKENQQIVLEKDLENSHIDVYERNNGYIYGSTKKHLYVYQIIEYDYKLSALSNAIKKV